MHAHSRTKYQINSVHVHSKIMTIYFYSMQLPIESWEQKLTYNLSATAVNCEMSTKPRNHVASHHVTTYRP